MVVERSRISAEVRLTESSTPPGTGIIPPVDYTVLKFDEIPLSGGTRDFEGRAHGLGTSFILVDMPPGERVRLHRHEYAEVFIVQEGRGTYTVGEQTLEVEAPRIVVVPARVPHAFANTGTGRLRQVDIHDSPAIVTEWLEPELG
jgi:mannose-6-phosphate isomerase-like protein (cupin superfamily)